MIILLYYHNMEMIVCTWWTDGTPYAYPWAFHGLCKTMAAVQQPGLGYRVWVIRQDYILSVVLFVAGCLEVLGAKIIASHHPYVARPDVVSSVCTHWC